MKPAKLDLKIWRGTDFELELVSQIKKYTYDPALHNKPADLKRTHTENLEFHGFVYEYVDFLALYPTAELIVLPPWRKNQTGERSPLLSLTKAAGDIELTSKSVKIGIAALETEAIAFDTGSYKLLLTTLAGKVDGLVYGTVLVEGDR